MVSCEHDERRVTSLERHAELVLADARREVGNPADLNDIERRHRTFMTARRSGILRER